jgi:hypothetical protein
MTAPDDDTILATLRVIAKLFQEQNKLAEEDEPAFVFKEVFYEARYALEALGTLDQVILGEIDDGSEEEDTADGRGSGGDDEGEG